MDQLLQIYHAIIQSCKAKLNVQDVREQAFLPEGRGR